MITFCVICYGCRGKQINRALSQLHFSSSPHAHISQTLIMFCLGFFFSLFLFISVHEASLLKNTRCVQMSVSYQNLMRNAASECTWGIFKKHLPCHCFAKYPANSPPHNVQRMSGKLATDAGLRLKTERKKERKNCFFFSLSAAVCLASPWIWSHYLFNLLA